MSKHPSSAERSLNPLAEDVLLRLRGLFEQAAQKVARTCSNGNRLDATLLDANQYSCYEIALAGADLLAAETVIASAAANACALDRSLAFIFVSDAVNAVIGRLRNVFAENDLDLGELHALATAPDLAELRRTAASGKAMASAGREVAAAGGEVGHVAIDESLTMAQEAFRRFASDVVAPMAQKIHRQDLTVPDALLQAMREMGVFGLSIPEQYGGCATAGHEDTLMMIAVTETLSEASLAAAGSLITRPEILARALISGVTEQQKSCWLPKIAAGDPLCAIAITEPEFGSDVASVALKGTRTEGGWLLNGAKSWCTFAGKAGLLMVVTRTDPDRSAGHRGLSLLLVENPSYDGHEFSYVQEGGGRLDGRVIATIGYRGMHSFDLVFQDFLSLQTTSSVARMASARVRRACGSDTAPADGHRCCPAHRAVRRGLHNAFAFGPAGRSAAVAARPAGDRQPHLRRLRTRFRLRRRPSRDGCGDSIGQWEVLVKACEAGAAIAALERRLGLDFRDEGQRYESREAIATLLEPWFAARPRASVEAELGRHRVCWGRYSTVRELLESDGRVDVDNPVFETIQTPGIGSHLAAGATARIAGHERQPTPAAPLLGAHTDEVLHEVLGLDSGAIGRLHDRGIVAGPERDPSLAKGVIEP